MSEILRSFPRKLVEAERDAYSSDTDVQDLAIDMKRSNGASPVADVLDALMSEVRGRQSAAAWDDRATSDRWLAPRIHYVLRLRRMEAADRGVWHWIAMRYQWYVDWRWSDAEGVVAEDRWWGPVNKQAFARLWWGAEIFRDGTDYRPVERAFVFQDLPNSYLHRPLVRCRSLALAIVDSLSKSSTPSAAQVNGLARVLNLATVGSPPEVETNYQNDDLAAHESWANAEPHISDWNLLPAGPSAVDTSQSSRSGGAAIVNRGWMYAGLSPGD